MNYCLPSGYRARIEPSYFADTGFEEVGQPDVYPEAASLARRLGTRKIIDVGCGTADKLVALHPEFEIVGIDYGPNIEVCRRRYGFGSWVEVDLDHGESLGVRDFEGALLVCADVIEHLVHPERLVGMLSKALASGADALVLSTPDRELTRGPGDLGPPRNPCHVREWTGAELERFFSSMGLVGHFGRTRSNDVVPALRTIFAVIPGSTQRQSAGVSEWFEERRRWQRVPEAMESSFLKYEASVGELERSLFWVAFRRASTSFRSRINRLGSKALGG